MIVENDGNGYDPSTRLETLPPRVFVVTRAQMNA